MPDQTSPPPPSPFQALVAAEFARRTAHLGPDGQRRVLETIVAANRHRRARLEAEQAIAKAKAE